MSDLGGTRPESYYVRFRGRVSGPFVIGQLTQMVERGRLTRLHEVSPDQRQWQRADTVGGLFRTAALPMEALVPEFAEQIAHDVPSLGELLDKDDPELVSDVEPVVTGATATRSLMMTAVSSDKWYYALGDREYGPVSRSLLVGMIDAGQATNDTLVWREGSPAWRQVRDTDLVAMPHARAHAAPIYRNPPVNGASHEGKALAAMILSILGVIVPWGLMPIGPLAGPVAVFGTGIVIGILSIVLSSMGMAGMRRSGNRQGTGLAITGLVIGIIDVAFWAMWLVWFFILSAAIAAASHQ